MFVASANAGFGWRESLSYRISARAQRAGEIARQRIVPAVVQKQDVVFEAVP
jgi:hypothetical protein